ncbi:MarR family transcriptional regulator [Pareuzebyella sediminis]|uniref:MarR family transcriptional regulator n=1 Tax=Pareuzebyella sediminis TaxID=2607998 RepID=UPI0011EF1830|nr:helix-turn-helix domain-containing protein [Pareuzebyella sediminis]
MDYAFIVEMLEEMNSYQESGSSTASVEGFRHWLNQKAYERESPTVLASKNNLEANTLDNELCKQVLLLGRYAKIVLRKGLQEYPELINEDFTYLYRLIDYPYLTKIQLIEKNAHEKQAGLEIIKRLVKRGLFVESPDPNDGRSKRISVSQRGRNLFLKSMKDVTLTSKVLTGQLPVSDKETLLHLLKELNLFHEMLYYNFREDDIEVLASLNGRDN